MALASVDLGGTNIAAATGTAEGEILAERQIPTDSHLGPHAVLDRIATLLKEMAPEGVEALGTDPDLLPILQLLNMLYPLYF